MKYVFVTGGVESGLGKGVTGSSIGHILKDCDHRVTHIKIDPYLNTDAGTMSPFEHGEVFDQYDGGEVDLDLGNYERFLDVTLTRDNNITTGKIYQAVMDKERRGDYLGQTVQVVPHVTDAIQDWIGRVAAIPVDGKEGPADVCVVELGGTTGDIESVPFIEAFGQFSNRVGPGNFCLLHVLSVVGEKKPKPTEQSIKGLRSLGITPNILACSSTVELDGNVKENLSRFCHVPMENIFTLYGVSNIWHVPLRLSDQNAHKSILKVLNVNGYIKEPVSGEGTSRAALCDPLSERVRIAMVRKYTGLADSSLSMLKAKAKAAAAAAAVSCSICLDAVIDDGDRSLAKLQCSHQFHLDCIGSTFNSKKAMQCPNCRKIEKGQWLYANDNPLLPEGSTSGSTHDDDSLDDETRDLIYW